MMISSESNLPIHYSNCGGAYQGEDFDRVCQRSYATRVKWLFVKGTDALHFRQKLETFDAGSLLFVCRHLTRLGTGSKDGWSMVVRACSRGAGKRANCAELR